MAVVKRYATYEDLEAVPDTKVAELIDGDLIVSPRPASPHARAATVLASDLCGTFDDPAGSAGKPGNNERLAHIRTCSLYHQCAGHRLEFSD